MGVRGCAFERIAYQCAVEKSSIWGKGKNAEQTTYKCNKIQFLVKSNEKMCAYLQVVTDFLAKKFDLEQLITHVLPLKKKKKSKEDSNCSIQGKGFIYGDLVSIPQATF